MSAVRVTERRGNYAFINLTRVGLEFSGVNTVGLMRTQKYM